METKETPLLVFADDWGRHPSSCQHLIRRVRRDYPLVWANTVGTRGVRANGFTLRRGWEKVRSWNRGLRQVDGKMWVIDLPMLPTVAAGLSVSLNRRLVGGCLRRVWRRLELAPPTIITTLPHVWPLVKGIPRHGLIYYCVDDFSHWPGAEGETVRAAEVELIRSADVVLAASRELQDRLSAYGDVEYFPHAVDFQHFAEPGIGRPIPEFDTIPSPRIGFFGLIYEQLDFELLTAAAKAFPQIALVMIGPTAYCPESFRRLNNVHFVGAKSYEELPHWIAGCDILTLAYKKNSMTRQINPLKLKECLATGKPIVSVEVPEAANFVPHVRVAGDVAQYIEFIREALAEPLDDPARARRQSVVIDDTWDARAAKLTDHLRRLHERVEPRG